MVVCAFPIIVLFVLTALWQKVLGAGMLFLFTLWSAPMVHNHTTDYRPGIHTTAFSAACLNTGIQRKHLLVFGCFHFK